MQHLLRKQIILFVSLLVITINVNAQKDEVFQQDHDELPYYLGMSMGLSNSYLSLKRGNEFLVPNAGRTLYKNGQ